MTMPSPLDPWDQEPRPVDPQTLPPGFYFPPGQEPQPASAGLGGRVKWPLLVIVVVVVIVAITVVLVL